MALLSLCPNHHRCAHQLLAFAGTAASEAAVWDWANERFDLGFLARAAGKVLDALGVDWAARALEFPGQRPIINPGGE